MSNKHTDNVWKKLADESDERHRAGLAAAAREITHKARIARYLEVTRFNGKFNALMLSRLLAPFHISTLDCMQFLYECPHIVPIGGGFFIVNPEAPQFFIEHVCPDCGCDSSFRVDGDERCADCGYNFTQADFSAFIAVRERARRDAARTPQNGSQRDITRIERLTARPPAAAHDHKPKSSAAAAAFRCDVCRCRVGVTVFCEDDQNYELCLGCLSVYPLRYHTD